MTFTPASPLLAHQKSGETDIHRWLTNIQGEPFQELLAAYPLDSFPQPGIAAKDQEALPNGPINPVGTCSETGRELRLHCLRDLTCVILRAGPVDGPAWEVLPAALSLTSEVNDIRLKTVSFNERYEGVPRMRLQARPDGIYWRLIRHSSLTDEVGDITNDFVNDMLSQALAPMAKDILDAGLVADPRTHYRCPENARFVPFSAWSDPNDYPEVTDRLRQAICALLQIYLIRKDKSEMHIRIGRILPHTPWRTPNRSNQIMLTGRHPNLSRDIRHILEHPDFSVPANLHYGSERQSLIESTLVHRPSSRHEEMAAHGLVQRLFPGEKFQTLFNKEETNVICD